MLVSMEEPIFSKPAERLREHLEARYGIGVTAMTDLDVGVWHVARADGPDWVARWFPAVRTAEAVAGDAEILRYVAAHELPAERMLAGAAHLIPDSERAAYEAFQAEIRALDTADGLPPALTHPDFVLPNVVATPDSMVLVDWAGAGRGPRAWTLAFLLYAEGAKDLRRVDVVLAGYRRHVTLTEEELGRLANIARARPLVLSAWSVCNGRATPTEALAHAAEAKTLAEAVAARARSALARGAGALGFPRDAAAEIDLGDCPPPGRRRQVATG